MNSDRKAIDSRSAIAGSIWRLLSRHLFSFPGHRSQSLWVPSLKRTKRTDAPFPPPPDRRADLHRPSTVLNESGPSLSSMRDTSLVPCHFEDVSYQLGFKKSQGPNKFCCFRPMLGEYLDHEVNEKGTEGLRIPLSTWKCSSKK